MPQLVKTLIICGLISGTQPLTMMGLLLVMGGATPRRNGYAYVAGAFAVQTFLVLGSSVLFGATVAGDSGPGRSFIVIRLVLGVAAVALGVLLRRPPGKPIPEIPNALAKLREMGPKQSMVAGLIVADYQGPVLASLALASTSIDSAARFGAIAFYTLFATGIPLTLMVLATRSEKALARLDGATRWIMRNRRSISSWILIVVGSVLAIDAALVMAL